MHKFNIGLLRKIRVKAEIVTNLLPAAACNKERGILHKDHKMRIANRDGDALYLPAFQVYLARADLGHAHARSNLVATAFTFDNLTLTRPCIGFQQNGVSVLKSLFMRHPGGHAAGAVSGKLGNRTVRIEEPDFSCAVSGPFQILYAVGADSCIALAQADGGLALPVRTDMLGLNYQKIIAAGMGLYKGNQSSSTLGNTNISSIAGEAFKAACNRSCILRVAKTVKQSRFNSP